MLCAGSGAALIDGAGRTLLMGVAYAELVLVAMLLVVATVAAVPDPAALPLPASACSPCAVPVGKLLLAGAPSASSGSPRARAPGCAAPTRSQTHRLLATLTLAVIGAVARAPSPSLAPVPSRRRRATPRVGRLHRSTDRPRGEPGWTRASRTVDP